MATESRKTILLVEDDLEGRATLAEFLRHAGFGVVEAGDGAVALRLLHANPRPCLIILDLLLPVLDGWSFCEALRDIRSPVPVVVCSGAPAELQESGSLAVHVEAFHPKPINPAGLLATLHRLCC